MKKFIKKLSTLVLVVAMVTALFVVLPVTAADTSELVFYDSFDYGTTPQGNSFTAQQMSAHTGETVRCIDASQNALPYILWQPRGNFYNNSAVYTATFGGEANRLTLGGDGTLGFAGANAPARFTTMVIDPDEYLIPLGDNYKFSFDYNNSTVNGSFSVRFNLSGDQKNYYQLAVGAWSGATPKSGPAWELHKCENGTQTTVLQSDYNLNDATSYAKQGTVSVSLEGGVISVSVTNTAVQANMPKFNETKTYEDAAPLSTGYIGFCHASYGGNAGNSYISALSVSKIAQRGNVTAQEMIDVYNSGAAEAIEALIRTEDKTNPAKVQSATLKIEDQDILSVNRDHFGLHSGLEMFDGTVFLDGDTENLSDGYRAMADKLYHIPVARFGNFNMINSIGPRAERKPTYNLNTILYPDLKQGDIFRDAPAMGLVEHIKVNQATNPDTKFILVLCINGQTAEDSLHTAQFLMDKKEDSDWGALRASYGIEEPVDVIGFELGNELYFAADFNAEYARMSDSNKAAYDQKSDANKLAQREAFYEKVISEYARVSKEHISAIRNHFPDMKFYACVCKHDGREYANYWTRGLASKLDDVIDGLDYHHYYGGIGSGPACASEMDYLQSVYSGVAGHKTKFTLTEHAIWSSDNHVIRHTLSSVIADASFYNTMQTRDDVVCANYHNIIGEWSIFGKYGNHYSTQAPNEMLRMYYNHLGDTVMKCSKTAGTNDISYLATRRKDGRLVIALANGYNDADINVTFNLPHQYKLLRQRVYTAPNLYSFVYSPLDEDIFVPTVTEMNQSNFSAYRLPAESVVFLTLEQTDSATPLEPEQDTKDEDEIIRYVEKNQKDVEAGDPFVAGGAEPDNVIYAEIPKEQTDGVYRFTDAVSLRKIVNHESGKVEIFVSNDDYAYKKLCEIPANETYINILTSAKYKYIKVVGGENVTVYSALSDIALTPTMQSLNLVAKIDGALEESAKFYTTDVSVALATGNTLIAKGNGKADIVAETETKQTRENVSVRMNKVIAENFSSYPNTGVIETPKLNLLQADIAGDWKLRRNYGGTVTTNPTARIYKNALNISGSSIGGITSPQLSYVAYGGDMTGVGNHYKLSFEGNKVSVACGIGVKFHIHDDGRSYYILFLNGMNCDTRSYWTFYKVKNGQIVQDSVRNGGAWTVYNESGKGPLHNNFAVTVTVDDNEIAWQIDGKRYANIAYTDAGSYTDTDFPTVNPAETTFGFAENASSSATSLSCTISRVEFTTDVYTRRTTSTGVVYTIDKQRLPEDTKIYRMIYQDTQNGVWLKNLEIYSCADDPSERFMDIVIPNSAKGVTDKVKLLFWNDDLYPVHDTVRG